MEGGTFCNHFEVYNHFTMVISAIKSRYWYSEHSMHVTQV